MLKPVAITALISLLAVVLAMNFATPEKKLERKIEHRYVVSAPQFRRELSVMLGPAILPGNRVQDFQNGEEIFPAMLEAIHDATHTITFETYIYWSGDIGKKMTEALSDKARAGVKVRVLLDWVGSLKMESELIEGMQKAGVIVHRYRPLKWYNLGRMNNRTHRKLLVVDGRVAFTGGVGIADQWEGQAQDPDHWRDVHFRLDGPAAAQFQAAFNDNWIKATGEVLNDEEFFPRLSPAGDVDAHLFISSPSSGSESMHLMYLLAIAAAAESIDLQASYFVPDELIIKALTDARKRGVKIRILVPGEHIDSETVRFASKASWGPMLQAGIHIYEYEPTMMHNKVLIVDKEMVSVGSTNFDVRSFRLNDEASLNIYDAAFAAKMTRMFEADLKHTHLYTFETWAARPLKDKLIERFVLPIKSQL